MRVTLLRFIVGISSLVLCATQCFAQDNSKGLLVAEPAMTRLFGCESIPPDEIQNTQRLLSTAAGLDFGSTAGKKPVYQPLPAAIDIKGVVVNQVLIIDNGEEWSYTIKLTSPADLHLLKEAFHMQKQKPTIKNGDAIYTNLYPDNPMAQRQASVNPKKRTFTCRWRTELSDEVE